MQASLAFRTPADWEHRGSRPTAQVNFAPTGIPGAVRCQVHGDGAEEACVLFSRVRIGAERHVDLVPDGDTAQVHVGEL
ncbi:MAG: hypothetical protein AAFZ87_12490, partial [Planctomycetota bacterium]